MEMGIDMEYNLIIKDFGKIKEANIHVSPLTLFVGDNNSGKSYLLSLIWALRSLSTSSPLFDSIRELEHPSLQKIKEQLIKLIEKEKSEEIATSEFSSGYFIDVFNALYERSKDTFISNIFNDSIHIGFLKIHMIDTLFAIKFQKKDLGIISFEFGDGYQGIGFSDPGSYDEIMPSFCAGVICWLLGNYFPYKTYFLPSARTGFVLSKTIINQYSRKRIFDIMPYKERLNDVINSTEPLTKPILHFLDMLESTSNKRTANKQKGLVQWIEREIIHGSVIQTHDPSQEIRYMPIEAKDSLSLRA
ncbi:hypothetical protein D7Y09_13895 [bacterium 1XD42-1]|nr:hypothetical protein D7X25_14610 [bacterium 1XD42-8]RKJ62368.1 hypothetical protein D7Y09_13895 [bacterium 1XD42-1]